ncbi:MAG: acyl carrier protein [Phycisphaerae bacterium]
MINFEAARAEILEWLAETIDTEVEDIDLSKPLSEIGIDSLDAVHMIATIEGVIQRELPENVISHVTCLDDILDLMRVKLAAA